MSPAEQQPRDADDERQILGERARELARPIEQSSDIPRRKLTFFTRGIELYAIETSYVLRVIPVPDLEPIPWAPDVFLGLVNHRGQALPVVDLGVLLGGQPLAAPAQLLVLGEVAPEVGLAISLAETVANVPETEIITHDVPEHLNTSGLVRGLHEGRRVVLFGDKLLSDRRLYVPEDS